MARARTAGARLLCFAFLVGCGGEGPGEATVVDGGSGDDAVVDGGTDTTTADGGTCEPFGRYPAPKTTFTLPAGKPSIAYPDVQKSFPDVDWSTLDRLYVPAGTYEYFNLGNLPKRDAARPLVITNLGGQVKVGPNAPGANYLWSTTGGANWILTGRYDPVAKTGDEKFPGHRCGDYAGSRGRYGFLSDDAFAKGTYLHMGVAVSDATDFELEFLEITRSGFAGIRLLNSRKEGDPPRPMANVRVHDVYVHDVDGEGVYFGWTGAPPSNLFPKLSFHDNRLIRTGNEALQLQDLGDGSEIHHNVVAFAALHWRDNGLGKYQDGNAQILVREGTVAIHHNVFVGGAALLLSFFSAPETGDGPRHVTFSDNYFADTLNLGGYLNGAAGSDSSFAFERNVFRGLAFAYDALDPAAKDPGVVFGRNASFAAPIAFTANTWEGSRKLVAGLSGPNGTAGPVTAKENVNGPVEKLAFAGTPNWDEDPKHRLEAWAPKATVASGAPAITYEPGDLVMVGDEMFECTQASSGEPPNATPSKWKKLPTPTDDVRALAPYAALGVR